MIDELYERLEEKLGHRFKNRELLERALTHRSFAHEQLSEKQQGGEKQSPVHYEQLEFLGDAVVGLVIGHLLLLKFPEAPEGDLSRLRARLVNISSLSQLAKELRLDEWVRLGRGEEATGGKDKPSILSDIYEALCAAVYLDDGFGSAFKMISRHFRPVLEIVTMTLIEEDYKTQLQELVQGELKKPPKYRLARESGPDHEKTFEIEVLINGRLVARGTGRSKKDAEQQAAHQALAILKNPDKMK